MSTVRLFRDDVLVEVDGRPHLHGSRCPACGDVRFPRALGCPRCHAWGEDLTGVPLSRRGRVHTFSRVHRAPPPFRAPYVLAFVQLPEGPRIFCQLDCAPDADVMGRDVELVVAPLYEIEGETVHGYKFRLLEAGA
jgi:uncharacterized OB-fold protein